MGWKAFALFATDRPAGFFANPGAHDGARATAIRDRLGLQKYTAVGPSKLEAGLYPRGGALFIGAYAGGTVLCHGKIPTHFFPDGASRTISGVRSPDAALTSALLDLHPNGELLAIVLHSVVDLWGYSLYSRGKLVRCAAGAADNGVFADIGAPLPEEQPLLGDGLLEEADGESLTFEVSRRMLGARIDELDGLPQPLTEFRRASALGSLLRVFGRSR